MAQTSGAYSNVINLICQKTGGSAWNDVVKLVVYVVILANIAATLMPPAALELW